MHEDIPIPAVLKPRADPPGEPDKPPGQLLDLLDRATAMAWQLICHPVANGTVAHTEEAGEMIRELVAEVHRLRSRTPT